MSVITRVASALIRSLASVASSADLSLDRRHGQKKGDPQNPKRPPPGEGFNKQNQKEQPSVPHLSELRPSPSVELKLVNTLEPSEEPEPDKLIPQGTIPPETGHSFLQLIQSLKQIMSPLSRQGGAKAYQLTLRSQKKTGRVRKGTMLDTETG